MPMDQRKLGNLALVTVAFAWGTMVPVISHLAHTWDPFFLGAVRYVCGVPLLFAALWMTEGFARPAVRPAVWRALVPGWVGLGGVAFILTIGIAHADPVIAAVIGGVIFRIPFDRRRAPAVVLAVVGCAFASIDWSGGGFSLELRGGEPLVLIAASLWAWYSIAIHRWLGGWSQLRKAANTMAHAAVPLIVGYLLA